MQAKRINTGRERTFAVVFAEGDEFPKGLNQLAKEERFTAASFTAIGALKHVELAWFNPQSLEYETQAFDEQLEVLTLAGTWIGNHAAVLPEAQAQLADPGSQRREMIDELKTLNGKMDRLIEILEGGKLQVQVPEDDEKTSDKPDARRR